jgi:integrase
MASLKPVLRDFVKESGKSTIFIRISHEGKTRYIKTTYEIEPKFMNLDGTISGKYPGQAKLNLNINILLSEYNSILADIGNDIAYMDINSIVKRLHNNQGGSVDIIKYFAERIRVLQSEGRTSYADTYLATVKWMKEFAHKSNILFTEVNLDFLNRFERWLLIEGKKVNTVRIYLNAIKAVLNHARDNDIIKIDLAFLRKFRVKKEKRDHRNLVAADIKKLRALSLSPARERALDLWLLSYYMLGMNFKDLLYLTPGNIKKGRIEFLRFKTKHKKPIKQSVKFVPEAQEIINKYKGDKYLMRFMEEKTQNRKTPAYKDIVRDTNVLLRKICKSAELDVKLSTYYARGSVATIANNLGIPKDVISEILGHSFGNPETEGYIQRDYTRIDEAQIKIIQAISK